MLIEEYDETKVHNLFKAEGVQIGSKKSRNEDKQILEKLKAGESVESLVAAGYDREFVEFAAGVLATS